MPLGSGFGNHRSGFRIHLWRNYTCACHRLEYRSGASRGGSSYARLGTDEGTVIGKVGTTTPHCVQRSYWYGGRGLPRSKDGCHVGTGAIQSNTIPRSPAEALQSWTISDGPLQLISRPLLGCYLLCVRSGVLVVSLHEPLRLRANLTSVLPRGSKQVRNGTYNQQQFFTVLPALLFSAQSAGQLFSLSPELARAKTAAVSIFELLAHRPTILKPPLEHSHQPSEKSLTSSLDSLPKGHTPQLEFTNVTFSYKPGYKVLDDVSFDITAGQTVALVGPSGAGKSSIITLIERLFDPSSGHVLIDGLDLRGHDVRRLRSRMSLLSQDPHMFPGSIEHNIKLGVSERTITQQEIEAAADRCGIHGFITSLPDRYATDVGSTGNSQLSGGQNQRIALARALIREPEILLLDEPTSSLDTISEKQVQEALSSAAKGRTTVIVAHRLASIQHVDKIIVLDGGKIVEQGSHSELVQTGGLYASMAKAQALA